MYYDVRGTFRYADASEATAFCQDIDDSNEIPAAEVDAAITITESGTYCNDGRRVGNTGMTDEELLKACPI